MIDADLAWQHHIAWGRIIEEPAVVAVFVQVLFMIERGRLEEAEDATAGPRSSNSAPQQLRGIVASRWYAEHQSRNVAQSSDRIVVVKMTAETFLIGQSRDSHDHRIGELSRREEGEGTRLPPNLIESIMEICKILYFRNGKQARNGRALRYPEE